MAVDTPARIAILGAGPIGLEAGLYARYLGYDVDQYERGDVAENVRQWGHVTLFSPFRMNHTTLGLAALRAQDSNYSPPAADALLTARQWREQYLLPLSQTDLLVDSLKLHTTVLAVGRQQLLRGDLPGDEARGDYDFRLLTQQEDGAQAIHSADIVIDAAGVFWHPNWLGNGGIPALGEAGLRHSIEYGLPDALGADRARYAGRHTLLIGGGYSAATTALALAELLETDAATRLTWITRGGDRPSAPLPMIADDRLPRRAALAHAANQLAGRARERLQFPSGCFVEEVHRQGGMFRVRLSGNCAEEWLEVDEIVANVGYRGDSALTEELQAQLCYASGGLLRVAARLLQQTSTDCLDQTSSEVGELMNPEANFYILGSKSFGRNSSFLLAGGFDQIRRLFQVIGDREDLDLYASITNLLP